MFVINTTDNHTAKVLRNKNIPQTKASVQTNPEMRNIFCPLTVMQPDRKHGIAPMCFTPSVHPVRSAALTTFYTILFEMMLS